MSALANAEFESTDSESPTFKPRHWAISVALLCGLSFAIYFPVVEFDFLKFDDESYVAKNEDIASGLTAESVRNAFTKPYVSSWHPVAIVSHAVDVELFGLDPAGHHVTSVVWHLLNACMLLLVTQRLFNIPMISIAVAALFLVHPQHVEPVAWISSRKDLVSTFFLLCAVFSYVNFSRSRRIGHYGLVALALVLGLLAKPMLVTVPFALLLMDIWPLNNALTLRSFSKFALEKIPLLGICIISSVATFYVQNAGGAVADPEAFPVGARLANMFHAYQAYVAQTFVPIRLAGFYPHTIGSLSNAYIAACVVAFCSITVIAVLQLNRRRSLFFAWFWFVGMLVPVIGIVQFGSHGMADRYMYVSHIGLFWGLVVAIWYAIPIRLRLRTFCIVLVTVLLGFSTLSSRYVHVWKNDVTLFRHALTITRPNTTALTNLGVGLSVLGYERESIHCFVVAREISIYPEPIASNDLGSAFARTGHVQLAVGLFEEATQLLGNDAVARSNLQRAREHVKSLERTIDDLDQQLAERELLPEEHLRLADALNSLAQYERAAAHYTFALSLDGNSERPSILAKRGLALARMGDLNGAIRDLEIAIRSDQEDIASRYDLARILEASGAAHRAVEVLNEVILKYPERVEAVVFRSLLIARTKNGAAD